MAEATDELSMLIRWADVTEIPVEDASAVLGRYFSRLIYLFGPERGALRRNSYVGHIIETFSKRAAHWAIGDAVFQLGGRQPDPADVNRAFEFMRQWTQLSLAEARAELPSHDITQALRVLPWREKSCPEDMHDESLVSDIHRIALLARREPLRHELQEQLERARAIIFREGLLVAPSKVRPQRQDVTLLTWSAFLAFIKQRGVLGQFSLLRSCLVKWRGLRFTSTSSIEQKFTQCMYAISSRQGSATEWYEQSLARVVQDWPHCESPGEVLDEARGSWIAHGFGTPRQSSPSRKRRCDKGKSRGVVPGTEAEFLQNRRQMDDAKILSFADAASNVDAMTIGDLHNDGAFEKEVEFTRQKRQKRLEQGMNEGLLLPDEKSPAIAASAEVSLRNTIQGVVRREAARERAEQRNDGLTMRSD